MMRLCNTCNLKYDDLYRLTVCPHESFDMATTVVRNGKVVGVATTVEDLMEMLAE